MLLLLTTEFLLLVLVVCSEAEEAVRGAGTFHLNRFSIKFVDENSAARYRLVCHFSSFFYLQAFDFYI